MTDSATQQSLKKAKRRGLNKIIALRNGLISLRRAYYNRLWGMDIHPTAKFSLSVQFDKTFPKGVHVGAYSYLAFDVRVLTHDMSRGLYVHTRIGENCFIGGRSLILPGVEIGDNCIVGAGSVVTKSTPAGTLVAGNPARLLRSDIEVTRFGRMCSADATEAALADHT